MSVELLPALRPTRVPWNNGRIIGQKRPLLPRHVWSIRDDLVTQVRITGFEKMGHDTPSRKNLAVVCDFVAPSQHKQRQRAKPLPPHGNECSYMLSQDPLASHQAASIASSRSHRSGQSGDRTSAHIMPADLAASMPWSLSSRTRQPEGGASRRAAADR